MNKIVLIVGLPGSGKTHLAKTKYVPMGYTLFDDPNSKDLQVISQLCKNGIDLVITDPNLCNQSHRDYAFQLFRYVAHYEVEFVFFENNEEKCKTLLKLRNDDRNIKTFKSFNYTIPDNVIPLEIFVPNKD